MWESLVDRDQRDQLTGLGRGRIGGLVLDFLISRDLGVGIEELFQHGQAPDRR